MTQSESISPPLLMPTARVFKPLLSDWRYKGAKGGRGSAKSWFFADLLIEYCFTRAPLRAVCIREVQKSLEQSVKRLIEDRIRYHGLEGWFRILREHIEGPNGGNIIFQGMQNHTADSIKSLEGYNIAWVEEAQSISQRSLDLLRPTIRTPGSELWFSWNPKKASDPVETFLCGPKPPTNACVVVANFCDNPWFPDVLRDEMEWDRDNNPDKYAHIWMGNHELNSEARVFQNFSVEEFDDPSEDTTFLYGCDFGFAKDPTAGVRCWERDKHTLMIDREVYKVGCEIDDTPALLDTLDGKQARKWEMVADSARPETISYLKRHGYPRMKASIKGSGSVLEGVRFLQKYRSIVIHPRCRHTVDEFSLYQYKIDPTTEVVLPVLKDENNHVIDAVRYAVEKLRRAKGKAGMVW